MSGGESAGKPGRCPACGGAVEAVDGFCGACGCQLKREPEEILPPAKLTWETKVNLFTDRHVLKGLFLALGGGFGFTFLLILILGLMDGSFSLAFFRTMLFIFLALAGVIGLLTALSMLILGGRRYPYVFTIDGEGILMETGRERRKKNTVLNSLLFVLGLLRGKPGAMGTAILAQSRQREFYGWKDIRLVEPDPRGRSIVLKLSRGRTSVLWCPPERYEEILRAVLAWHKKTEPLRRKKSQKKKGE